MIYLFFDTETTGKWDFKANYTAPQQPHIVQLAWRLVSCETPKHEPAILQTGSFLVNNPGVPIPAETTAIHGITSELTELFGILPVRALKLFTSAAQSAQVCVAHNYQFDSKVIASAYHREGLSDINFLPERAQLCTMTNPGSIQLVNIQGPRGLKWPKLSELHQKLFCEDFSGAHDALVDVDATMRCFFRLQQLNLI